MHGLILGSRTLELFEEGEIVPAMRQARSYLEAAFEKVASGDLSDFEMKHLSLHCDVQSTCAICEYPDLCEHNRKEIDHLVQIAGINKSQIEKLKEGWHHNYGSLGCCTTDDAATKRLCARQLR